MWNQCPYELTARFPVTERQVGKHRCTGEHLIAHSEGGTAKSTNIVAACLRCNQGRHKRKIVPVPEAFKKLVGRLMSNGKWHQTHLAC
jgi:hypothetical protein